MNPNLNPQAGGHPGFNIPGFPLVLPNPAAPPAPQAAPEPANQQLPLALAPAYMPPSWPLQPWAQPPALCVPPGLLAPPAPPGHWFSVPPPPPPVDAFPSVDPRLFAALLQSLLNTERGAVCAGTSPHDRATLIAALKEGAAQGLNSRQVIDRLDNVR